MANQNFQIPVDEIFKKQQENNISDQFWSENPQILWDSDRLTEFYPHKDMTIQEKFNAITRFLIYLMVILFIIFRNFNLLWIPIIGMSILYLIFYNDQNLHSINLEQFDQNVKKTFGIHPETPIKIDDAGNVCQKPTADNPFMNVLISDITENPHRPPACSVLSEDIKEEINKYFDYNLYKEVPDIWEKRNSQRQFYSVAGSTIPNNREDWMKWCWSTDAICKQDNNYCLKNEDLRVPGYSG